MTKISPLVVLDCDSTAITQEVIDLIAARVGKATEVSAITEAAMRGEYDFTESLTARIAMLAGLSTKSLRDVARQITFSAGFEKLIGLTHATDGKVCVVSGGFMEILDIILPPKMVDRWHANRLVVKDEQLTGQILGNPVTAQTKAEMLARWAAEFSIPMHHTIAVGDGANDLEMMKVAGLSVAFNAKPVVQRAADYSLSDSLDPVTELFSRLKS
ncbi:phosphoserine phosphatase SerB [Canibacter sp. lx-45]|uniref:phosphoserine phosphatase SerB n=1 Tax=Canibacter zhuwentaonis TaxID=2837491 RepID=UPI001BDCEDC3|nr:phosphoserine phosphatase SerB [Canibacter zhuwentaonis]MBT1035003.1 phosphoserine phosphatase SerB [Canibacter zhuwentaonis]